MKLSKPILVLMLALSLIFSGSHATTYCAGDDVTEEDCLLDDDAEDIFIY